MGEREGGDLKFPIVLRLNNAIMPHISVLLHALKHVCARGANGTFSSIRTYTRPYHEHRHRNKF